MDFFIPTAAVVLVDVTVFFRTDPSSSKLLAYRARIPVPPVAKSRTVVVAICRACYTSCCAIKEFNGFVYIFLV